MCIYKVKRCLSKAKGIHQKINSYFCEKTSLQIVIESDKFDFVKNAIVMDLKTGKNIILTMLLEQCFLQSIQYTIYR